MCIRKTNLLLIVCLLLQFATALAQQGAMAYDDTLKVTGEQVLRGNNDTIRHEANARFVILLRQALEQPQSFAHTFDSVKTLSVVTAPDNSLRLLTWILMEPGGTSYSYFGFVQTYDKKKKTSMLFPLTDASATMAKPEQVRSAHTNWYGALYYQILYNKYKGKKYYTVIGWKGNNRESTKKVVDVLMIKNDRLSFGAPLFKNDRTVRSRLVYEYNAQAVMSLRYEAKKKMIVMDHLSPSAPRLLGKFEHYGPDFTYDGYKFEKGKWQFYSDIDIRNERDPVQKKFGKPQPGLTPPSN